jgi:hypothetical protein
MTDITIPPEALEAAARAIWASCQSGTLAWEDLPSSTRKVIKEEARAACLAMLAAWPGMRAEGVGVGDGVTTYEWLILPLPKEPSDAEG